MGNLKRIMSASLATLLIVASMTAGISAKSYDDVEAADEYSEQIGILSDIGVIKGTAENEFSPEDNVTREQMAMLLFRLMIGKDSAGTLNTTAFKDLYDDTYSGAISWANASGYIIGTTDSTFEPTEGITLQDAMTMLVRALGQSSLQMNGGYPWTYIDAAVKLGLDENLEDIRYTKELTRAEAACLLYNALTAEYLIPKTANNGMTFYEATTIIERVFNFEIDESVIVATNNFSIGGLETVTKSGYVTVRGADGLLTVKFSELGLEGTADENLGKNVRLVYKNDEKTKLVSVLGCTEIGKETAPEAITAGTDNAYIQIDGVKYQVVSKLSDALSTNANELLVYAYSNSGKLTQITSNAALSELLGAYDAELIFDDKNSEAADRLIIKSYGFGRLQISGGRINLAGNLKETEITVTNPDKAGAGDYVLYYFNEGRKSLEIAAVLPVSDSAVVTRLTNTTATIGGTKYTLGNDKLGISASTIKSQLTVGENARVVVLGGAIIAVNSSTSTVYAQSQYLVAQSGTTPVFLNGKFGYVMEANINGVTETVFVTNQNVEAGKVYRYTTDAAGNYTLIPCTVTNGVIVSGNGEFVQNNSQNDEIAFVIGNASGSSIIKGSSYFTLSKGNADAVTSTGMNESAVSFVTDSKTVIIVKNGTTFSVVNGVYGSSVKISDGAYVTAVFSNEVGSVETLRYLYISDGSLGSVDSTANSVKVLANTGREYIDGKVYTIYTVLNFTNGKVETMMSLDSSLTVGGNYLTNINGFISSDASDMTGGVVTGFTATTVTVGGETYKLANGAVIVSLNSDNTATAISLSDTYMGNVEITLENGQVKSVILLGKASFSASYNNSVITVSTSDKLTGVHNVSLVSLSLVNGETETPVSTESYKTEFTDDGKFEITVTADKALDAGTYTLSFTVENVQFTTSVVVK